MDIEVVRADLGQARTVDSAAPDVADGEALFRIDSFALTANNVTYGAVGDLVGYWNFYPATEDGWGRIPVWGFADVVESRADGVAVGERYFGFWPMSTDAVLRPGSPGPTGFTDVTPHRTGLPAIYNRYLRTPAGADAHTEALTSLLRPLFATSFLIDAWLADESVFGADSVVLTSASSKTALGLAYLLKTNGRATVVGLTSAGNVGFVEDTDAYDRVVPYGDLPDGLDDGSAVLVDFAGNADVVSRVHRHFGDRLQRSVAVGFTHRAAGDSSELPGPAPEFFFAPDHILRRMEKWGGQGMAERIDAARAGFDAAAGSTIDVVERTGTDEIVDAWIAAVAGEVDPRQGVICHW
jgi:hypothetical protein